MHRRNHGECRWLEQRTLPDAAASISAAATGAVPALAPAVSAAPAAPALAPPVSAALAATATLRLQHAGRVAGSQGGVVLRQRAARLLPPAAAALAEPSPAAVAAAAPASPVWRHRPGVLSG